MTTVAACASVGIMACDSNWMDTIEKGAIRKVWRIRGDLIGFAGSVKDIGEARAWFAADCAGAKPRGDVSALILRGRKLLTWDQTNGFMELGERRFAIGTGALGARCAMEAGADVARAVRIACKFDASSGGRVRVYKLEP